MNGDFTHASFFSGVGGLDLGLERAGWRTVSFSEIDPYASAVLAERWPGVPNLGDILSLGEPARRADADRDSASANGGRRQARSGLSGDPANATLWTGGFPCQDLSVAGKRRGMVDGTRSNLAHAFLDLVERHRPAAILLENVPGLLSSHRGRDMAVLLGRMVELGYGVAYRVLDAQHFGVPQRRRRVFIVGLRSDPDDAGGRAAAERAAAVLSVGARCGRHPATGHEAGTGTAERVEGSIGNAVRAGGHGDPGIGRDGDEWRLTVYNATAQFGAWQEGTVAGNLSQRDYKSSNHLVGANTDKFSPPPDADGVRAPDGLAGRLDDREIVGTLRVGPAKIADGGPGDTVPVITQSLPTQRVGTDDNDAQGGFMVVNQNIRDLVQIESPDPLLPLGLDSHRYRCCGNGVVAPVAEWLGLRLAEALT
jgi:DNA-cytosine methyltransferase